MARLALTVAGGIIGGLLALPTGGLSVATGFAIGSALGGIVGQLAFPGKGTHVYGPRVNDLQVASSAPGSVIARLFGSMRLGGQIIWSGGIQEVSTDQKQSAKGGPSVTQTTYTYFVSFAAGFCEGEATITRAWGDSKLIFDRSGGISNKGGWLSTVSYVTGDVVSKSGVWYRALKNSTGVDPASRGFIGGFIGQVFWAVTNAPNESTGHVAKNVHIVPTIYTGSETQTADPLMASTDGASVTPAYRGLCYAVWEKFPLADFGNRLPNIRAEVTANADDNPQTALLGYQSTFDASPALFVTQSPDGKTLWAINQKGTSDPNHVFVQRYDLLTNTLVASGLIDVTDYPGFNIVGAGTDSPPTGPFVADAFGNLWMPGTVGQHSTIFKIDGRTFQILGDAKLFYSISGGVPGFPPYSGVSFGPPIGMTMDATGTSLLGMSTASNWSGLSSNGIAFFRLDCKTTTFTGQFQIDNNVTPVPQMFPVCDEANNAYILLNGTAGSGWSILKINMTSPVALFIPPPNPSFQLGSGLFSDVLTLCSFDNDAVLGTAQAMLYCQDDKTLILFSNTGALIKVDTISGAILESNGGVGNALFNIASGFIGLGSWSAMSGSGYGVSATSCNVQFAMRGNTVNGQVFVPHPTQPSKILVAFSSATLVKNTEYDITTYPSMDSGEALGSSWSYDGAANALCLLKTNETAPGYPGTFNYRYAVYHLYLDRLSAGTTTVASVIRKVCQRAEVPDANIDVSLVEDIVVTGYPVSSLQDGKTIINNLGQVYFVEGRETDFKLQFVPRGLPSIQAIPEIDLGMLADGGALVESIGQEQDLPKNVEVIFIDPALDYQQNKQHKVRHHLVRKTINTTSISVPLVLAAQEAEQLCDRIMWTADNERHSYKTNAWKSFWLLLDSADVVTFTYNGSQLTARVSNSLIGQNFAVTLDLIAEDSGTYVSVAPGVDNTGFIGQIINGLANTQMFLLDTPYFKDGDADATGNTGFYVAMGPGSSGRWTAGALYKSSDGQAWEQVDAVLPTLSYGLCLNVLPAPPNSPYSWDRTNSLTIRLLQGTAPTSDTLLNVLNGFNGAILVPSLEIIQFADVVDNGNGTYTLSYLLRGRRGTEWATGTHTTGESILFLNNGGINHEQTPTTNVGATRKYKGVTVGAELASGIPQDLAIVGRDLMPYAPSHISGVKTGGDWEFGWVRRTRLGGGWLNGGDTPGSYPAPQDGMPVPLNEDGQGYDVEVLDTDNVTVKRTVTVTSNRFAYSASDQTVDFGSPQSTIRLNVYQRSATVGRGFTANVTITESTSLPSVDASPAMSIGVGGDTIAWEVE